VEITTPEIEMRRKNLPSAFPMTITFFLITLLTGSIASHAAVRDEVIEVCFHVDDANDATTEESIRLRLVDLGAGMYMGTGRWSFVLDTIETGDEDVDFDIVLTASALVREDQVIELSMVGTDFERSTVDAERVARFNRVFASFNPSLLGTARGYAETELFEGGYYSLTLRPIACD
jgi:hypothetical protein